MSDSSALTGWSSKSSPLKIGKSKFPLKFVPLKACSSVPCLCDADFHWFVPIAGVGLCAFLMGMTTVACP